MATSRFLTWLRPNATEVPIIDITNIEGDASLLEDDDLSISSTAILQAQKAGTRLSGGSLSLVRYGGSAQQLRG